jgi:glycosyltransferase involved in cell wall biosynthesis
MKEVSIFVYDLGLGGTEKVMVNLANFLCKNNCRVSLVMIGSDTFLKKELLPQVSVISFNKKYISKSFVDLIQYIRGNKIDCFISNVWPLTVFTILAGLFKRGFCNKVLLVEHCHLGTEFSKHSPIFRFFQKLSIFSLYRFSSKVVAVSEGVKEDLCISKFVNSKNVTVIYNPVNIVFSDQAYDQNRIQEWKAFSGAKLISVGSLKEQKNYPYLLEALSVLKRQGFDFKQLILGEGPTRASLANKILDLGLQDNVYLAGSIDQPVNLVKHADTFILSSKFEGFGLVIVEALAAGTTVVSTDCKSGPAEILQDGKYGFLAPVNNVKKFAEAIRNGYLKQINSKKLIERANEYTIETAGPKYLELIHKI